MKENAHNGPIAAGLRHRVAFGPFVLDAGQRRLTRDGRAVPVQPKTLDLLILLVENAGNLVTHRELMDKLWPDVIVTESSLVRCVREARRVLEDDATNPRYIATVRKGGYRFVGRIRSLDSARHPVREIARPRARVLVTLLIASAILVPALIYLAGPERGSSDSGGGGNTRDDRANQLDVSAINADRRFRLGEQALAMRTTGIREARRHFELALKEDPGHAPSMAGLALALSLSNPRPPDAESQRRILGLSERALEIDPGLPLAHAAVGMMYSHFPRRYARAEEAFRMALAEDPEIIEALSGLATIELSKGEIGNSVDLQRRALEINPTHTTVSGNLAIAFAKLGRYEEALELVESLGELPAARRAMVYPKTVIYQIWGRQDEVVRVLVEALGEWPDSNFMARALARTLTSLGDRETAEIILERLGETCESLEQRFFREAPVRIALGGMPPAQLLEWQKSLPSFADRDRALLWRGRLALERKDPQSAIQALATLFPDPDALVGWQGDYTLVADAVQTLAWADFQLGNEARARTYLEAVRRDIDERWTAGYRSFYPLTVVEARNAALLGDEEKALSLLQRASREGWIELTQLRDPRWAGLADRAEFDDIVVRLNRRARLVLQQAERERLYERLLTALDSRAPERECEPSIQ